jgi:hypothetical protein
MVAEHRGEEMNIKKILRNELRGKQADTEII